MRTSTLLPFGANKVTSSRLTRLILQLANVLEIVILAQGLFDVVNSQMLSPDLMEEYIVYFEEMYEITCWCDHKTIQKKKNKKQKNKKIKTIAVANNTANNTTTLSFI